ncbi:MAG: AAA family ATPase [Clostridium sp.]|nr:AAA family ATPase [Clostridium sp.]
MPVIFNNEFEIARLAILAWTDKAVLRDVTIIRDVFGKIAVLAECQRYPGKSQIRSFRYQMENQLGGYFGGNIYWYSLEAEDQKKNPPAEVMYLLREDRLEWGEWDGISFYRSERVVAKKAWIATNRLQNSVWPYEETLDGRKPKVVSFYSFKGGMGRTTALAAVALLLVRQGKNVIMIDTDIEAPGLSTLFFDDEAIQNGVLDYLIEHPLDSGRDIREYVQDVTDPALLRESDGNLYLLAAGKVDINYLQKLGRIDYQDHCEGALRQSISEMLEDIARRYPVDYILIDARAGFHDMGGIVAAQIPHGTVLFGNHSRQSWDGLTQVLRTIAESHADDMPVAIVDCMCDGISEAALEARKQFLQKAYMVCLENYYTEGEEVAGPEAQGVAHSPMYLPFENDLKRDIKLFSGGSPSDNARVQELAQRLTGPAYEAIKNRIETWFGEEEKG